MLVLTRKNGESVRIADYIEVVVLECKHGKVRLGFRCSDDVNIVRSEIWVAPETAPTILTAEELEAVELCQAG